MPGPCGRLPRRSPSHLPPLLPAAGRRVPAERRLSLLEGVAVGRELGLVECQERATLPEKEAHHLPRNLPFAEHDMIGPKLLEVLDLGVGMGARHDLDAGIGGARRLQEVAGLEGVRDGADQALGAAEIGRREQAALAGVAEDDLDTVRAQALRSAVPLLDDEERLAALLQRLPDQAADTAIADEDGVVASGSVSAQFRRGCRRRLRRTASPPRLRAPRGAARAGRAPRTGAD